jgi:integrase
MSANNRRSNGQGTVTTRPGRAKPYLAQLMVNGKRLSKSFATKTEATRWLNDTNYQSRTVTEFDLLAATVKEATHIWLGQVEMSKSTKTYQGYKRVANKYIIAQIGKKRIFDIKPFDLQQVLDAYRNEVSERELLYIWQTMSSLFGYLVAQGVLANNPVKVIAKPKQKRSANDFRYLSSEQAGRLIKTADANNDGLANLYYLALSTGMREGEILGLRWHNVDWDTNSIIVVEQVQWADEKRDGKPGYEFTSPKTEKSKRRIVVGVETMRRLRAQKIQNEYMKQLAGKRWQKHDLVFPSTVGTPMEPTNLIRRFKKLLKLAGLPDVRFHDLRHTHATLLFLRGAHVKVVSERLGHADITITLQTYSHVIPTMQEGAATMIEGTLPGNDAPMSDEALPVAELDNFETELL